MNIPSGCRSSTRPGASRARCSGRREGRHKVPRGGHEARHRNGPPGVHASARLLHNGEHQAQQGDHKGQPARSLLRRAPQVAGHAGDEKGRKDVDGRNRPRHRRDAPGQGAAGGAHAVRGDSPRAGQEAHPPAVPDEPTAVLTESTRTSCKFIKILRTRGSPALYQPTGWTRS